jgi:tetratricopeptide (TPR) repeat protein
MPAEDIAREKKKRLRCVLLISSLLAVMTLSLYWPVRSFDFVNFDDNFFLKEDYHVHDGLSMEGLKWSLTTLHTGNWHPLTWFSHMADIEIYQYQAGGHHWTSVMIHTAGSILLFLVLSVLTRSVWPSALVAALFAIHPLHVESVAWVAERKDVLSGFFWILTMGAYTYYVRDPTIRRYLLVLLAFALSILSKPMVVTLPFVLLLLDYWPLERFAGAKTAFDPRVSRGTHAEGRVLMRLVVEKIPLFLMAAGACIITLVAQREVGAIWPAEDLSLVARFANALVSYMDYTRKMVWPNDLAVLYPHAGMPAAWKIGIALLFLVSTSYLAVRKARTLPFLIVGWLWYLGTLVPVIGIVQVGSQSMADRYTYIPLAGLLIVLAWGAQSIVENLPGSKRLVAVFFLVALSWLLILARSQVETWKNSVTLFDQALAATEINPMAHQKIGEFYSDQNDCKRAVPHFLKAIEMKQNYAYAYHGLGVCASREADPKGALYFYRQALQIDPQLIRTLGSRGLLLIQLRRYAEAEEDFQQVLRLKADHEGAHTNLAVVFIRDGRLADAEVHLTETLRIKPRSAEGFHNLGLIRMEQGRYDDAIALFRQALALAPQNHAIENMLQQVIANKAK